MNDDILSILVGVTLVLVVHFSLELALRKRKGKFSFYPDLITPISLLIIGYLLAAIGITFFDNAGFLWGLVLLSIVIIPASLGITIIKSVILLIKRSK